MDIEPGDRASTCGGLLEPVAAFQARKGWTIRHRCSSCGHESVNRASVDDPACPDDPVVLGRLTGIERAIRSS